MVQIDIPIAFIISQLTVDIGKNVIKAEAKEEKGAKPKIYYQYLARCLLVAGLVIAPAGGYLLAGWPGWESQYWWWRFEQPMYSNVNALLPALFTFTIVLGGYLGFELGYRLVISDRERYLKPIYIGLLALTSGTVLLGWPAPVRVGTLQEFAANPAGMAYLWDNWRGFFTGWVGVIVFFSAAFAFFIMMQVREARAFTKTYGDQKIEGGDHVEYTSGYLSKNN
jgi:hypothetical protein